MRRRQKNIYSLLDRIGMELTGVAQREGINRNEGRKSPKGREKEATEGVAPEGAKRIEPEVQLEDKKDNSGGMTSSDFTDRGAGRGQLVEEIEDLPSGQLLMRVFFNKAVHAREITAISDFQHGVQR